MDEIMNVISIDPGNNLGVTIFTISLPEFKIVKVVNKQYVLDNLIDDSIPIDKMFKRILVLQNICTGLAKVYTPVCVFEEAAFLNNRFPKAVMQLSQYISTIELSFYNVLPGIKFFRYPPKYIKRYIGAGGNAKKDDMTLAVSEIDELKGLIDVNVLTEHEIDSIAIGYVGIIEIRTYPHILYIV